MGEKVVVVITRVADPMEMASFWLEALNTQSFKSISPLVLLNSRWYRPVKAL